MPTGAFDLLDVVALTRCQLGLHRQVGHADNGVHRGADLVAHIGEEIRFSKVGFFRCRLGTLQLDGLFLQHLIENFTFRNVTRRGKHTLQPPVPIVEGGGIQGDHRFLTVPGAHGEFVIGDLLFAQHEFDACLGPLRISEVIFERRADQFVAGTIGERLHLFIDVGDDTGWISGHQRVDIGFEQRTRVKLMIAQPLAEQLLLGLDLLTGRVVRADQQIPDDGILLITQGRDRHDCRETAAILADAGQLVDVLDTA